MQDMSNVGVEPGSQVPNSTDADAGSKDVEALQAELAKWQARVPKLAAALRERTEAAERLQEQLVGGQQTPGERARAELIEELEAKLSSLNSKHQDLQGQLHSRDVEANALRQDAAEWRAKWQALTEALDEQAVQTTRQRAELESAKADLAALEEQLTERQAGSAEQEHAVQMLRDEAASLKKRNEQLFETTELANKQLDSLGSTITELRDAATSKDAELADVRAQLQAQQGVSQEQLATRDAQIRQLHTDVDALHTLVETKQEAATELEAKLAAQAGLDARVDELETQLATAGQEQEALAAEAAAAREQLAQVQAELQQQTDQLAARTAEQAASEAVVASANEALAAAQQAATRAQSEADERLQAATQEQQRATEDLRAQLAAAREEVARLEGCVQEAASSTGSWEEERRALSAQLHEAQQQVVRLQSQLEERSSLVVGLEQEKLALADDAKSLAAQNSTLTEQLHKAERHAAEHAEHITQLDSRLERQRELMHDLEGELAQAQQTVAKRDHAGSAQLAERDREIAELREELAGAQRLAAQATEAPSVQEQAPTAAIEQPTEVQKLERMLRDRTEAVNKLQWQLSMTEQSAPSDDKSLVVLNQQLTEAREQNDRLTQRVQELEQQLTLTATAPAAEAKRDAGEPFGRSADPAAADDLTQIKGIGPKVAAQLQSLGIGGYLQLAELDLRELDDAEHPLNPFKGRMVKDAWIAQARELELRKPAGG